MFHDLQSTGFLHAPHTHPHPHHIHTPHTHTLTHTTYMYTHTTHTPHTHPPSHTTTPHIHTHIHPHPHHAHTTHIHTHTLTLPPPPHTHTTQDALILQEVAKEASKRLQQGWSSTPPPAATKPAPRGRPKGRTGSTSAQPSSAGGPPVAAQSVGKGRATPLVSLFEAVKNCVVSILNCVVSILNCVVRVLKCGVSILSCVVSILSCVVSILNCVVSILSCVVSILNCVVSIVLNCLEQFPFHFLCDSVWCCLFAVLQPSRVAWFQAAATPASKHPFK